MSKSRLGVASAVSFFLLIAVLPGQAQAAPPEDHAAPPGWLVRAGPPARPDTGPAVQGSGKPKKVIQAIADFFEVPVESVEFFLGKGLGPSQVARLYFLNRQGAGAVNAMADAIVADPNRDWGAFMRSRGLHPGNSERNLGIIMRATKAQAKSKNR